MKNKEEITDKIQTMLNEFEKFVKTETVVGAPIVSNDVTIIPLVDVSFGLGFGFSNDSKDGVQGGGLGGNITPNSLLIIQNGETKLISIKDSNSISTLIPEVLDRLNFSFINKKEDM